MKRIILPLLSFVLLIGTTCCSIRIDGDEGLEPSNTQVTKKYHVSDFKQIESNVPAQITFTQSDIYRVEAQGPENYVGHLVVSTKDNLLSIKLDNPNIRFRSLKSHAVILTISAPSLLTLSHKGVGDIHLKGDIQVGNLGISNKGVGDIYTDNLTCNQLSTSNGGVGDITLKGQAQTAEYHSKGVGNIHAENMIAKEVTIELKGVGNISCFASKNITATSKGVGNINVYGNPETKELNKIGVGSINER